jgi:hypothetical protein
MTDLTSRQILDAIERALETVSRRFATEPRLDIEPKSHVLDYSAQPMDGKIDNKEIDNAGAARYGFKSDTP